MTGSYEVIDTETKISLVEQAVTAKVQSVMGDAAHLLFDRGMGDHGTEETPIVFDDLTNQEKLDIVDRYVWRGVLALANSYKSEEAQRIARETEAADPYDFD